MSSSSPFPLVLKSKPSIPKITTLSITTDFLTADPHIPPFAGFQSLRHPTPSIPPTTTHEVEQHLKPITCPTCSTDLTTQSFNMDGTRTAMTCYQCFTQFERDERVQRQSDEFTSFPSLLEEHDTGAHASSVLLSGTGVATETGILNRYGYGALKRVLGGTFGLGVGLFGRGGRGRKRSGTASSNGSGLSVEE